MVRFAFAALMMVAAAKAQATVQYSIDLTAPEHHTADVSVTFPASPGPYLDVKMPAWRTGRYQILDLANGVRGFWAQDAGGKPLSWEKIDKSTWRVRLPASGAIRVGYQIYGNELGLRTRHIDDSHAYLDASAVFLYADPSRGDDVSVSLKVPPGWNSFSGMQSTAPNHFIAANWDLLVDSPIETGVDKSYRFQEGGRDYEVVFWGDGNYDPQQVVADIRKIVPQASSIWNGYPFQRYVFIIHATDGAGGATEHRNSTVIQMPRYLFQPRKNYLGFLGTTSHEFIHTWNVKAYRGAGLVPYEYQNENYSNLLWLEEGSTEYFADQLLLRAGIMKPDEYFANLASAVDHSRHTPGSHVQSVAEASFDEWISVSGDRALNASANIYNEGSLVSWLLDLALLEQTHGRVSYRDVHQRLYQRYPAEQGKTFTAADIRGILRELTGTSWDEWWARNVDKPADVDFNRLLEPVGLRLTYGDGKGPATTAPWAGWKAQADDGGMRLTSVEMGSPAWNAGFVPDDVIAAFDGKRVTSSRFDAALGERKAGETVTVSFFRRDQLLQKKLTLGGQPKDGAKVVTVAKPTAAQKALFQRWLLIPYPRNS